MPEVADTDDQLGGRLGLRNAEGACRRRPARPINPVVRVEIKNSEIGRAMADTPYLGEWADHQ